MSALQKLLQDPVVRVIGGVGISILIGEAFLYSKIGSSASKLEASLGTKFGQLKTEMGQFRTDLRNYRELEAADRRAMQSTLNELLKGQRRSWW